MFIFHVCSAIHPLVHPPPSLYFLPPTSTLPLPLSPPFQFNLTTTSISSLLVQPYHSLYLLPPSPTLPLPLSPPSSQSNLTTLPLSPPSQSNLTTTLPLSPSSQSNLTTPSISYLLVQPNYSLYLLPSSPTLPLPLSPIFQFNPTTPSISSLLVQPNYSPDLLSPLYPLCYYSFHSPMHPFPPATPFFSLTLLYLHQ